MKLAVLSDIHGNLPALEAVLADAASAGVDSVVNLGDIVSGPLWPRETAELLMRLALPTIAGNHERQLLTDPPERMGAADAAAAGRLDARQRAWLAALPATLRLNEQVLLCHGTPVSDRHYLLETVLPGFDPGDRTAATHRGRRTATPGEVADRLDGALQDVAQALVLCGHTHLPRALALPDGRLVVNPGSVGLQAYDDEHPHPHFVENGTPHARYALLRLEPAGWQIELRAVPYDWQSAAREADRNGRPDWADALRSGRVGRLEAEVLGEG